MAMSLVMLIPYAELSDKPSYLRLSGFAYAFTVRGMTWAKYIVALGACVGIFTSTGIGIYGIARILTVFAREGMIPACKPNPCPKNPKNPCNTLSIPAIP